MRIYALQLLSLLIMASCTPYNKKKLDSPIQNIEQPEAVTGEDGSKTPPKNGFVFLSIDNKVEVYVNDSLAWESELIFENPKLYIPVELTPFLNEGINVIKIRLWNEGCDGCHHNYWYIRYELYEDGDVVDYIYDDANRVFQNEGWKFEKTHEIYFVQ